METAGKVITCKAAVLWEPHQPLSIEQVEVAAPKAYEIRVKIIATGICHSDQLMIDGLFSNMKYPVILGHEGAGIVESVGEGVEGLKPGDKVIPLCLPQCGACRCCKHPNANYCDRNDIGKFSGVLADNTSRFACKGRMVYNFLSTSTFTEYTVVEEYAVVKIDDAAPLNRVCLIGCGFSTGYGAAVNTAKVTPGSTCVVIGLGGIGLSVIIGCKVSGAARIIAVDINPEKFPKALEVGATECLNPKECSKPIHDLIVEMTNGGAEFTFESVGRTDCMTSALKSSHSGFGVCVILGVVSSDAIMSFDPMLLLSGRTVKGCFVGGLKCRDCFPGLVSDYMAKKFNLDILASNFVTLDQVNDGFENLRTGKGVRTIVQVAEQK